MPKSFSLYADLIKYKLSLAVVLSSLTGFLISGNAVDSRFLCLFAGVFFLAAGSSALNQYSEAKTDSMMERTMNRPIPSGRISESETLRFIVILFLGGVMFLSLNGFIPLILGIINVLLYNVVYTRLKKITLLSILPGGLVGAIPPLIGYSSAGGSLKDVDILGFSVFMFLWQVPHFWLILAKYGEEYRKAGFPSISAFLSGLQIKRLVFAWVLVSTMLITTIFTITDTFGRLFPIPFFLLNIAFILLFHHNLFGRKRFTEISGPMILINSYGILIMLLLISISLIRYI
jgi:heme o synthase